MTCKIQRLTDGRYYIGAAKWSDKRSEAKKFKENDKAVTVASTLENYFIIIKTKR